MDSNKTFSSKNFPTNASSSLQDTIEEKLRGALNKLQIIPESTLRSIFIGVLYRLDVQETLQTSPSYASSGSPVEMKFFIFDEPGFKENHVDANRKQSAKNSVFHLQIQDLVDTLQGNQDYLPLFPLSILCIYNNPSSQQFFDDLVLKALRLQKNSKKDNIPKVPFIPVEPVYSLDRIVLSKNLSDEIEKTLALIEKRDIIYGLFGFDEVEPKPKVILNFHGPSGTGKTITAHAIAKKLQKRILALNYAEIESKYVGEAPKNLVSAFECAATNSALLFFDEADSFLGKRIRDVSSSSDQAVNSLRSQMLILLEQHEGIVIFATNLAENYDKAFESRILKHLKFELPDELQRKALIKLMLPSKLPYRNDIRFTDTELGKLVELSDGFSGRLLKNVILDSLTNAVMDDREYVLFDDFDMAFIKMKESLVNLNGSGKYHSIELSDDNLNIIETVISDKLTNAETSGD